jgi:oligopeptide/dipeptide ABC transporter ATP-binding protein
MMLSTPVYAGAEASNALAAPVLTLEDLRVDLHEGKGKVPIIDGLSLTIGSSETLALVGESGAGKSLSALAIMGLLPRDSMSVSAGRILLGGEDLLRKSERDMRRVRGGQVAMVFQDPLTALNPVLTVGRQLMECVQLHNDLSRQGVRDRALELLELVRIPAPASRLDEYPHRLSGGMRQRVMIAMALAGNPQLLLADEPTTALDVTISAQILDLLRELQQKLGVGILLITHDLHAVRSLAQRVAVMYSGRVVEHSATDDLFSHALHPYSQGLLQARPRGSFAAGAGRLTEIPGTVPSPGNRPSGCAFRTRCSRATALCAQRFPDTILSGGTHVACFHAG